MTMRKKSRPLLLGVAVAAGMMSMATGFALAQAQAPVPANGPESPAATAAPAVAGPATAVAPAPAAAKHTLGLGEIETILQKQGIRVHELEVRDAVVEAEGRDSSNRKVELILDRRSGEILSRRFDD